MGSIFEALRAGRYPASRCGHLIMSHIECATATGSSDLVGDSSSLGSLIHARAGDRVHGRFPTIWRQSRTSCWNHVFLVVNLRLCNAESWRLVQRRHESLSSVSAYRHFQMIISGSWPADENTPRTMRILPRMTGTYCFLLRFHRLIRDYVKVSIERYRFLFGRGKANRNRLSWAH